MTTPLPLLAFLLLLNACASDCPQCRADVAALRDQVARLGDEIAAINGQLSQKQAVQQKKATDTVVLDRSKEGVGVQIRTRAIIFGGRPLTIGTLSGAAEQLAARQPDARVGVDVDSDVSDERVVRVLETLRRAGLSQVYLRQAAR